MLRMLGDSTVLYHLKGVETRTKGDRVYCSAVLYGGGDQYDFKIGVDPKMVLVQPGQECVIDGQLEQRTIKGFTFTTLASGAIKPVVGKK